jgi:hypothetical protein|tara:strand:+ start:4298 stop:4696 length:399 start_codon:yes stop_codon:yes gene_type:complete
MKWYEDPVCIAAADCPEIQDGHVLEKGDKVYVKSKPQTVVDAVAQFFGGDQFVKVDDKIISEDRTVWLPDQSQLQAMSGLTWHDFDILCWSVTEEILERQGNYPSKEMAGIRAIMSFKYNKVWSGSKWEIEN